MEKRNTPTIPHPSGEAQDLPSTAQNQPISLDTAGGRVHVEWDPETPLTPLGQLAFFANFLQAGGLFEPFCAEAPFDYTSPNAPSPTDVIGSALLSILSGHWRYAHLTALRHDSVNPPLLGMNHVMSEDSVRRGFKKMASDCPERAGDWLRKHLRRTWEALLQEEWILDIDSSVKPIYGRGEGASCQLQPAQTRPAQPRLPHLFQEPTSASASTPSCIRAANTPPNTACPACGICSWTCPKAPGPT